MKILVVGTGGSIVSGISTAADEMMRTLPRFGHAVERLNAGSRMRRRPSSLNVENLREALADAVAVFRRARRARAEVVWIHTFGVPTLPALRALAMVVAARMAGCPAVIHFHAFGLERLVLSGGRPLRVALRALGALGGAMVVVHEAAGDALRAVNLRTSVHILPNWVEIPDVVAPLPSRSPLRLVFVGGLVARKGVPQLIDAMRLLDGSHVELRLVGGAGEDGDLALERLHAETDDLVRTGRLSFAGEQDPKGVRAELRAAHLFVLPSEAEGMPISMLEAMAEGRGVLVSDAGNMKAMVEETGCGWVLPDRQPATIADYIRRIVAAPALLPDASAAARRAAAIRYAPEARHEQIDGILASLERR